MEKRKTATLGIDSLGEKIIVIKFPYDIDLLNKVRQLPGRKWHKEQSLWSAPFQATIIDRLEEMGFELDDKLKKQQNRIRQIINECRQIEVPGLKGRLFPYQQQGVAFIEAHNGRALIADEMGLGKTVQALAWLQLHPELRPAIIVVPASLKLNWEKEANIWMTNPNIEILYGERPYKPEGDILVINYDILPHWVVDLQKLSPLVLTIDECHYVKNKKAKRTKAIQRIGRFMPNVICLSGTPIENRPEEILVPSRLVDPNLFPNDWEFYKRYCKLHHTRFGWDHSGACNTEELHYKLINSIMLRRLKKDVMKDLPPRIHSFVPLELEDKGEYKSAEQDFITFVRRIKGEAAAKKASKAEALVKMESLKQLAVTGKLNSVIKWIEDFLEVNGKLVVFATHTFVIDELMKYFADVAVKLDGRTKNKQEPVEKFQNDPKVKLFIGQTKAAAEGITLTAASHIAILEFPWTPGKLKQIIDRIHRIGQTAKKVVAYYLMAHGTIEERIAKLLDKKKQILDGVLDGKETDEADLISALMEEYSVLENIKEINIKRTKR
jgi:SWI/SNF-related matrix-associated actin-dependent regulator 1 of chromatin subfamily A